MPTPTKGPRLGGGAAHERLMLRNLATSLFEHDRITTTEVRAKRLRPVAERLITIAKRGDLHARRRVMTDITDKGVVHKLFTDIAPALAEREGGYTRITKVGNRKGDNAPMAVIEIVREPVTKKTRAKKSAATATTAPAASDAPVVSEGLETPAVVAGDVVVPEGVDTEAAGAEAPELADEAMEAAVADEAPVVEDAETVAVEETVAADEVPTELAAEAAAEAPVVEEAPAAPAADATEGGLDAANLADSDNATIAPIAGAVEEEGDEDAEEDEFPKSAKPTPSGRAPRGGYTVKGNKDSMLYHVKGSQWYDQTIAEVWFKTAEDAEAAGFQPAGGAEKQDVDA